MAETLLTFDELARALNCSPATIRRHLQDIPHFRIGRVVRFRLTDVLNKGPWHD